jgi:hypothetical protein
MTDRYSASKRRAVTDAHILRDVQRSFLLSDRTYGARRILDDVRDAGHHPAARERCRVAGRR